MDILRERDKLYRHAIVWTVIFTVLCCGGMIGFKMNETYFDTYSAVVLRSDVTAEQENTAQYAKYNMRVQLADEQQGKLVLPLTQPVAQEHIVVQEEFTKNKLVITLKGAADCVAVGTEVISDSSIMEAVGIYRRQEDIVVEIYGQDTYAYTLTNEQSALTVDFTPVWDTYHSIAVVYLPYEEKSRLQTAEENEAFGKLQETYGMKVYACYEMQDKYTQQEVIDFANHIHADLLLGMGIEPAEEEDTITTWCNPMYFIPDFGSVELADITTENFCRAFGMKSAQVVACDEMQPLVWQASVPATDIVLYSSLDTTEKPELEYDLNRKLRTALVNTLEQVATTYFATEHT